MPVDLGHPLTRSERYPQEPTFLLALVWHSDGVASKGIREAWLKLIEAHEGADPGSDWFSPLFEALLVGAARHPVVREFYAYKRLNQLCFFSRATTADLTDNEDFPAIGVGSEGVYAVLDRPGPAGVALMETPNVNDALDFAAPLLLGARH